jgi:hypothetical protein
VILLRNKAAGRGAKGLGGIHVAGPLAIPSGAPRSSTHCRQQRAAHPAPRRNDHEATYPSSSHTTHYSARRSGPDRLSATGRSSLAKQQLPEHILQIENAATTASLGSLPRHLPQRARLIGVSAAYTKAPCQIRASISAENNYSKVAPIKGPYRRSRNSDMATTHHGRAHPS